MVNYSSGIAIYGAEDIPQYLEAKTKNIGIKLILVPKFENEPNLGSHVRDLVNNTSALVIYKTDDELHTLLQFYFAANKKIFFLSEDEKNSSLPKGIRIVSKEKEVLLDLLKETETQFIESSIGNLELRFNSFGLTYLKNSKQENLTDKPTKQAQKVSNQLESYFAGKRKNFNLKVHLKGTDFQRKVWEELINIPYGQTISYGELANKVGDSNAYRAVGLANSKNPIRIVIPCHRVLSKEGDLTGYAGGLKLKQFLLDIESKQTSLF